MKRVVLKGSQPSKTFPTIFKVVDEDDFDQVVIKHPNSRLYIKTQNQIEAYETTCPKCTSEMIGYIHEGLNDFVCTHCGYSWDVYEEEERYKNENKRTKKRT